MRKFKIKVKCTQTLELELPATFYEDEDPSQTGMISAEQVANMEENNVLSDPTYFDSHDDATIDVQVDVQEVKDA